MFSINKSNANHAMDAKVMFKYQIEPCKTANTGLLFHVLKNQQFHMLHPKSSKYTADKLNQHSE